VAQRLQTYSRSSRNEPFLDVWSRTKPYERRRAVILFITTAALFAGLCCFTFWMRTGSYGPWDVPDYAELILSSMNPVGQSQVTLADFLLFPISVDLVPVQIVIMGLLLASLASIPILVGILYRFPASLAFVAMVALLAAMPWFALVTLLGCFIASHRMFRLPFRYASAILGLIPVVIYFLVATRQTDSIYAAATPYRFKLYAPWVIAVLGSCVICAMALGIARLINYRAGGIAPVLALLFAIPVLLFHSQVGRDELEYRLIEQRFGPNSPTAFIDVDLRRAEAPAAESAWKTARRLTFETIFRRRLQRRVKEAYEQLANNRAHAVAACDEFMEYFPHSRYVPCVLFIKGRALDMRVNGLVLEREDRIEHVSDYPSAQSHTTWQALVDRFEDSETAAVAWNRLAVLDLRDGAIDRAAERIRALRQQFDPRITSTRPASSERQRRVVFAKLPPAAMLGIDVAAEVIHSRRLEELIKLSRDETPRPFDPLAADLGVLEGPERRPLQALMTLNPYHPDYREHLLACTLVFRGSRILPTVGSRLAMLETQMNRRIQLLESARQQFEGEPGGAEIMLRYAQALIEAGRYGESTTILERLKDQYPGSCWTHEAREHVWSLAMLTHSE
jgi:outer membrane protein assembly factor BamD (BamD/ComL family)